MLGALLKATLGVPAVASPVPLGQPSPTLADASATQPLPMSMRYDLGDGRSQSFKVVGSRLVSEVAR